MVIILCPIYRTPGLKAPWSVQYNWRQDPWGHILSHCRSECWWLLACVSRPPCFSHDLFIDIDNQSCPMKHPAKSHERMIHFSNEFSKCLSIIDKIKSDTCHLSLVIFKREHIQHQFCEENRVCKLFILARWGWDKWPSLPKRLFRTLSLEQKHMAFNSNFTEICSQLSNQYSSVGSDNDLSLIRRQTIIWANNLIDAHMH